jgi:glucose-6-phosphate 1-dehydrogenase
MTRARDEGLETWVATQLNASADRLLTLPFVLCAPRQLEKRAKLVPH